ncbi:MAG: CocE/NonD family hydrolase [Betaproteobacteria bacterium]|nr:MAG: CocE/NonD family hydrolase [Betaproteobacteria bacterium]
MTAAGAPVIALGQSSDRIRSVREFENVWIPMYDGVRLAARIWLPEDAEQWPVPAILNYCPYFARLFTRPNDDARFPYYARRGYACVRVDIRGSGDSDGRPLDEYVKQEQDDALEIIAWIARQPWCTGAVGMEGISWSGFNCLQVAARQPPALAAIITHCSTDDRYTDDAHYKGGCVIHDMLNWGTVFLAFQGQAPDPDITGRSGWRERWLERLGAVEFNLGNWLTHPHRDAFWRHASVNENYGAIKCPVYAIGGWVDAYRNSVFRLLAGLSVPRKGLIGPWTHIYPHQGDPGPAIGYLDAALRWSEHWLKGVDTGIMTEPVLRVWMQDTPAVAGLPQVPGRWVAESSWPTPRLQEQVLFLTGSRQLELNAPVESQLELAPIQTVGVASGNWCPSGAGAADDLAIELSGDQRLDDARSLCFDSAPLEQPFEILGAPIVALDLSVDKPVAYVAVRLNIVASTGESRRVTYGVLNLCHRNGSERPVAMQPGHRYLVKVPLDHAAQRFPRGSRLRVALSTAYWPLVLPSPEPVRLTLFAGVSSVTVPIRTPRDDDAALRPFSAPYVPPVAVAAVSGQPGSRQVEWDVGGKRQVIHHNVGNGVALLQAIDTRLVGDSKMRCEIHENSTDAEIGYQFVAGWERGDLRPRIVATSLTTTTRTHFEVRGNIDAFDGEDRIFTRTWSQSIARDLV